MPKNLEAASTVMRHALLLAATLLGALLSGCTSGDAVTEFVPPRPAPEAVVLDGWPELAEATIRPGAQVFSESGQCTANFLFGSADNATLYLGIAAHCFMDAGGNSLPLGSPVRIEDTPNAGTLAWTTWTDGPDAIRDFALIELASTAAVRSKVHPAVLHYGGPTALADGGQVTTGAYVVSYGHSQQRARGDPDNPREGFVVHHADGEYWVWTDHPGIGGDSGSGLMTSDGAALAVLSRKLVLGVEDTLGQDQTPTVNYYVELDTLLMDARREPHLEDIQLVTWRLLTPPALPLPA